MKEEQTEFVEKLIQDLKEVRVWDHWSWHYLHLVHMRMRLWSILHSLEDRDFFWWPEIREREKRRSLMGLHLRCTGRQAEESGRHPCSEASMQNRKHLRMRNIFLNIKMQCIQWSEARIMSAQRPEVPEWPPRKGKHCLLFLMEELLWQS